MSFYRILASGFPDLKKKLKSAGMVISPEQYVEKSFKASLILAVGIFILSIFMALKFSWSFIVPILLFFIFMFFLFFINIQRVDVTITKRAKEIDKDVLFAGRFLLVKLNSGRPLINSIIDASHSYGVASKYFQEIVREIDLGTPMETALENAYKNTPSKRFRKILFQISNSLKIGVDITAPLEATLEEITQEQLIEIQRYGKKLNSIVMFYMLVAIVVPSLGITLFSIIASLVALNIDMGLFGVVLFLLLIVQLMFIAVFKSIRPNLNI
ncbi:MAG: type II secretion system F family protein [Candidatus Woesearchaeota archaeon]